MSRSLNVEGFIPPDEKFKKMKAAYDSCVAAGVPVPEDVQHFFDDKPPDATGVRIGLSYDKKYNAVTEYENEYSSGYEVNLEKLPKDIKVLRFTMS